MDDVRLATSLEKGGDSGAAAAVATVGAAWGPWAQGDPWGPKGPGFARMVGWWEEGGQ